MGKKKRAYIARLKFPTYETKSFFAELTQGQADRTAEILEKYKRAGAIEDYYLGPPNEMEQLHALILPADALRVELVDLIEMERRLSSDR